MLPHDERASRSPGVPGASQTWQEGEPLAPAARWQSEPPLDSHRVGHTICGSAPSRPRAKLLKMLSSLFRVRHNYVHFGAKKATNAPLAAQPQYSRSTAAVQPQYSCSTAAVQPHIPPQALSLHPFTLPTHAILDTLTEPQESHTATTVHPQSPTATAQLQTPQPQPARPSYHIPPPHSSHTRQAAALA